MGFENRVHVKSGNVVLIREFGELTGKFGGVEFGHDFGHVKVQKGISVGRFLRRHFSGSLFLTRVDI